MQAVETQVHAHTQSRRQLQLDLLQEAIVWVEKLGTMEGVGV